MQDEVGHDQTSAPKSAGPAYRKAISIQEIDSSLDRSLAATLSASVYTDNVWSLQTLSSPLAELPVWRALNVPENDPQQLARAALVKEFYQPVKHLDLGISGQALDPITSRAADWSFDHNVFYFGDLACAAVVERNRLDGTSVVELCFRGTEKSTTGDASTDRRNMVGGYFLSAYKDLDGHYERHRALIDAVIKTVNERQEAGEKVKLHVSGHSLGGSMAEIFAQKDAAKLRDPSSLFVCTFGSPGIGQSQNAFSMLVKGFIRLIGTKLGLRSDNARQASSTSSLDGMIGKIDPAKVDTVQYIDPNDPIPKLGLLGGYAPTGRVFFSCSRERDPLTGDIVKGSLLDFNWHSMSAYEKSRQLAFSRLALRSLRYHPVGEESIAGAIGQFKSAKDQAERFVSSTSSYLDNPGMDKELASHIERVLDQARTRSGMIPQSAPNSRADDRQLASGAQKVGSMILEKLAARRATSQHSSPQNTLHLEAAMASIADLSRPKAKI
jgi:hypothetical protein